MGFEVNAIKGFHLRVDQEGKENVNINKLYTGYLKRGFRESLEEPIKPGDVVLVKTRGSKNTEKFYKSKVLVMEVFNYDGEEQHSPVIAVLERYNKKEKEQIYFCSFSFLF